MARGFASSFPVPQLADGDVISVSVSAAPIPEALPEINLSDDNAAVVVSLAVPCPADFNNSGSTTSADITAFLSAWFAGIANGC
ncbi:MAG: hypothetical protein H7Y88_00490 [Phycisphaerales bacterium]|nr:hypothetical protein [Phycisphaerales bacterium]